LAETPRATEASGYQGSQIVTPILSVQPRFQRFEIKSYTCLRTNKFFTPARMIPAKSLANDWGAAMDVKKQCNIKY